MKEFTKAIFTSLWTGSVVGFRDQVRSAGCTEASCARKSRLAPSTLRPQVQPAARRFKLLGTRVRGGGCGVTTHSWAALKEQEREREGEGERERETIELHRLPEKQAGGEQAGREQGTKLFIQVLWLLVESSVCVYVCRWRWNGSHQDAGGPSYRCICVLVWFDFHRHSPSDRPRLQTVTLADEKYT